MINCTASLDKWQTKDQFEDGGSHENEGESDQGNEDAEIHCTQKEHEDHIAHGVPGLFPGTILPGCSYICTWRSYAYRR